MALRVHSPLARQGALDKFYTFISLKILGKIFSYQTPNVNKGIQYVTINSYKEREVYFICAPGQSNKLTMGRIERMFRDWEEDMGI